MEKKMFWCKLVKNGYVVKSLRREGHSAEDVKAGLEKFQWPDGTWVVSDFDFGEDGEVDLY